MKYLMVSLALVLMCVMSCSKEDKVSGLTVDEYIAEKSLTTKELSEGVHIIYTKEGTGKRPILDDKVKVAYKGFLTNGNVFDQNKDIDFLLRNVIRGWQIGIRDMPVGSSATLIIPASAGYGDRQAGSIPPNSTLIFDVELKAIL